LNSNGINAFVSIMRGCDNMCSFCVVPFTRGRERSREPQSIIRECTELFNQGYREVTLLGQNVDSYKWRSEVGGQKSEVGSQNLEVENDGTQETETGEVVNFANLLEMVAAIHPDLRVRFSTSHPKDITDEVLYMIAKHDNICNYIHLPVQSGNSRVLELMNRTYDRKWYINRIDAIRRIIPGCAISTDVITGFCSEKDEEHRDTLSMMDYVQYDFAYMFMYSERPGTLAAKRYADDIPDAIKSSRLKEVVAKQQQHSYHRLQAQLGKIQRVLIEGFSKKSDKDYCGRSDQNAMVVFPVGENYKPGQYVNVLVERTTTATLIGRVVE
jgi:tRNA-2-methylthio-N6-dimethylallyladenosine synthase